MNERMVVVQRASERANKCRGGVVSVRSQSLWKGVVGGRVEIQGVVSTLTREKKNDDSNHKLPDMPNHITNHLLICVHTNSLPSTPSITSTERESTETNHCPGRPHRPKKKNKTDDGCRRVKTPPVSLSGYLRVYAQVVTQSTNYHSPNSLYIGPDRSFAIDLQRNPAFELNLILLFPSSPGKLINE